MNEHEKELFDALVERVIRTERQVLELERHVYGYDLKTRDPLPPSTPKELRVK